MRNLKDSHIALLDQALFSGSNFLLTIVLSKLLGLELFGLYSSILLGAYLCVSLTNAIIIQPAHTGLAKFDEGSYTAFLFVSQFGLNALLFSISLFILGVEVAYAVFGFAFLSHDFIRKYLLSASALKEALWLDLIWVLALILLIASYYFVSTTVDFDFFIYILSAAYLPSILFGVVKTVSFKGIKGTKKYIRYHFKHGKWLLATAFVQWWSSNLLVVASGVYLGVAALGVLRLVQSVFGVANLILQSFENYLLPKVAKLMQNSPVFAYVEIKKAMALGYIIFIPLLILSFVFSSEIISLLTNENVEEYAIVIRAYALLYFLILINQPIRILIRTLELNQLFFLGYVMCLVFNLLFANTLIQSYGMQGVLAGLIAIQLLLIGVWSILLIIKKQPIWKSYI